MLSPPLRSARPPRPRLPPGWGLPALALLLGAGLIGGCSDDKHRDKYYGTDMGTTYETVPPVDVAGTGGKGGTGGGTEAGAGGAAGGMGGAAGAEAGAGAGGADGAPAEEMGTDVSDETGGPETPDAASD